MSAVAAARTAKENRITRRQPSTSASSPPTACPSAAQTKAPDNRAPTTFMGTP
jgi:hypothetical protein